MFFESHWSLTPFLIFSTVLIDSIVIQFCFRIKAWLGLKSNVDYSKKRPPFFFFCPFSVLSPLRRILPFFIIIIYIDSSLREYQLERVVWERAGKLRRPVQMITVLYYPSFIYYTPFHKRKKNYWKKEYVENNFSVSFRVFVMFLFFWRI